MKYEYTRRQEADAEAQNLMFMKDGLKFALKGIEAANEKWGPLLQLKGWSKNTTQDMTKFDRCLTALYLRFFRKKTLNPFFELLWLIVGSAVIWHFQIKLGEDPSASRPEQSGKEVFNKVHDIQAPPKGQNSFEKPSDGMSMNGLSGILNLFGGMK